MMTLFLPDPYSRDIDVNSVVYKYINGKKIYARVIEVITTGFPNCDTHTKYIIKPLDKEYVKEHFHNHEYSKTHKKELAGFRRKQRKFLQNG